MAELAVPESGSQVHKYDMVEQKLKLCKQPILTEKAHRAMVAFAMRLASYLPKHDHHDQTKEGGNGGDNLDEDTDARATELAPGIKYRRIEAVNAGRRHLGVGHVGVVILMTDVLARCDGG